MRQHSARRRLAASLAATICVATGFGHATGSQDRAQQPFRADVDMVLVDCIVLDRSGEFLHGLTRDDFRLFEEDEPVEISFFSVQQFGKKTTLDVAERDAPRSDRVAPVGATGTTEGTKGTSSDIAVLPRYMVIFVDGFNTSPAEWDRLRPALIDYLRTALAPEDRVLVAMLTPDRRLRVVPEFTGNLDVLASTLEYVQGNPEIRERTRRQEQVLLESLRSEATGGSGGDAGSAAAEATALRMGAAQASFFALERRDEVLHTLDTLTELATHLDRTHDVAGPKSLLFVSGGLPQQPGANYFYILDEYAQQADPAVRGEGGIGGYNPVARRSSSNDGIQEYLTAAIGRLNRLNYTVYAIDARGAGDFAGDPAATRGRTTISPAARTQIFQDAQNGLTALASGTGGLSFTGSNNFAGALAEVFADTTYRYVLGYRLPAHDAEDVEAGKFYRVRVEVNVPGAQVRAREGYLER